MAYKTTITFPVQKISPEETIQLLLEFNHDAAGTDRDWSAADYGLKVITYGTREISYDLDDAFVVYGKTSMVIGDPEGTIDDLLFGSGAIALSTSKQFKVTKKINGVAEFIGKAIEETIESDLSTKTIRFSAAPRTDEINKRMIFDDSGNPLNPFEYDEPTAPFQVYVSIKQILLDIYKLVNPDLVIGDITFNHDWLFYGESETDPVEDAFDFTLDELSIDIWPLFFDASFGISTASDILKRLAVEFAAFTGITSNDKPFFKKLFSYDSGNTQSVIVHNQKKGFQFGLIKYVKVVAKEAITSSTYNYYTAEAPDSDAFTEKENEFLRIDTLSIAAKWASLYNATNLKATRAAVDYYIMGASDPALSYPGTSTVWYNHVGNPDFIPNNWLLADFWFSKRGTIQNCRVDKFSLKGITYDFLKDFSSGGSEFQIIKATFNDATGMTECEAIYCGEV